MVQIAHSDDTRTAAPAAAPTPHADRMRTILEISDELIAEASLDNIWRKAVELGREKLGIERCSIWRLDIGSKRYVGTYGTGLDRETLDETRFSYPVSDQSWIMSHRDRPSGERSWWVQVDHGHWDVSGSSGRHWVATTPIVTRNNIVVAVMFNDCAISGAAMDEALQDLIAVYCTMLGNLLSQKEMQRELHTHAQELQAIVEIADELMGESSLDTIWRKAVERARERLGIERCAIFRADTARGVFAGTYGTDARGHTTDEHEVTFPLGNFDAALSTVRARANGKQLWSLEADHDRSHFDQGWVQDGRGWVAQTPIMARDGAIRALMYNDCAISNEPVDENRQNLLAVYCSMLGGIVSQKLLDQDLHNANTQLEQRVARRTAQLAARMDAERLLLDITSDFVRAGPNDMGDMITSALKRVCAMLRADSAHVFLLADDGVGVTNAYTWQAADVPQTASTTAVPFYRQFPQWRAIMQADEVVAAATLADLPAGMDEFARWLEQRGVGALLSLPLIAGGTLIGELSFNIAGKSRKWQADELTLLRVLAKTLASAIDRQRISSALQEERDLLERRVDERTRQLQAVMDLSQSLSAKLDIGPMLDQALRSLAQLMPYHRAVVWRLENDDEFVPIRVHDVTGAQPHLANWTYDRAPGSAMRRVFERLEPAILQDIWLDTPAANSYRRSYERIHGHPPEGFLSAMLVPLVAESRVIGFITISGERRNAFDQQDAKIALVLANQIAISIENAQLHHKSVQTAALTERNRLARELHDSVSQALFGIVLASRTLMGSLPEDDDKLTQIGEYMLRLSEAALIEMRALIFELRPESVEKLGLMAALHKQAAELCARANLTLRVKTDGKEPDLPIAAKESIYRIGIEALQNTIKHARATAVDLEISVDNGAVQLEIRDDGTGFDPGADHGDHIGLKSMRERAVQNGGDLSVSSQPGRGSTVRVTIPLNVIKSAFALQGAMRPVVA